MSVNEDQPKPATVMKPGAVVGKTPDDPLVRNIDHSREELLSAAGVFRKPVQLVVKGEAIVRRVLPMLPFALTAMALLGIFGALARGRRVKPMLLVGTGLDLLRLYRTYKATAALGPLFNSTALAKPKRIGAPRGGVPK